MQVSVPELIRELSLTNESSSPEEIASLIAGLFETANKVRLTFPEHLANFNTGNLTADCRFLIFILAKVLNKKGIRTQTIIRCKETNEIHPKLLVTDPNGVLYCLHFKKDEGRGNFNVKFDRISEDKVNEYSLLSGSPELVRDYLDRLHSIRKLIPKDPSVRLDAFTKRKALQLIEEVEIEFEQFTNNKFFQTFKSKFA